MADARSLLAAAILVSPVRSEMNWTVRAFVQLRKGFHKTFTTFDADLMKFGVTKRSPDPLDTSNMVYEVCSDIRPNSTIENVKSGMEFYKKSSADCMITIDGGSSMNNSKDFSNMGLGIARSMAHTLGSSYAPHGVAYAPGKPKAAFAEDFKALFHKIMQVL